MDDRVLARLRCPVCAEPLTGTTAGTTRALRCPRGHSFDTARQGYVNLLAGRSPHTGDSADMVAARADFLAAGHYDTVAAALADTAVRVAGVDPYPLVVEPGAGTGHYLAAVLAALPDAAGLALDVSKPALRRAARAPPRAAPARAHTRQRRPQADPAVSLQLKLLAPPP
ncbi:putative RNA methyltransferase, partial [Micromonospora chalcea]